MKIKIAFILLITLVQVAMSQPPCPPALTNLVVTPNQANYCQGSNINFKLNATKPFVGNVNWTFAGTANLAIASGVNRTIYDITGVQTTGNVTATGVLNNNGPLCSFSKSFSVVVVPNPVADAGLGQLYISTPVNIGGSPCGTGGTGPYTYNWMPGGLTSCPVSVSPASMTTYTLTVTDANGCIATSTVTVVTLSGNISYVVPKKTLDAGYQIPKNNKVYFMFEEEYVGGNINYKIFDYTPSSPNIPLPNVVCNIQGGNAKALGDNRFAIDLSTCTLNTSRFYVVELTNDKNEKSYFKFLN